MRQYGLRMRMIGVAVSHAQEGGTESGKGIRDLHAHGVANC